jgi:hypothetical protein
MTNFLWLTCWPAASSVIQLFVTPAKAEMDSGLRRNDRVPFLGSLTSD